MIDFERSNPVATPEGILAFEKAIGAVLPEDYSSFLQQFNGGRPREYEVAVPTWGETPLNRLLGLGAPGRSDLAFQTKRMADLLPEGVIPIGDDPGGNFFCLTVSGPDAGAVSLWDHEADWESDPSNALFRVAGSFSEFVACARAIKS